MRFIDIYQEWVIFKGFSMWYRHLEDFNRVEFIYDIGFLMILSKRKINSKN